MKIKRVYLLLIFIFSIFLTNLHSSTIKPSLSYEKSPNIIILVDGTKYSTDNLIPLDLSDHDHSFITIDNYKDFNPLIIITAIVCVSLCLVERKKFKKREVKGLNSIVLWDQKRVLRN